MSSWTRGGGALYRANLRPGNQAGGPDPSAESRFHHGAGGGLGLTQEELGARLGVDKMFVSRWERGQIRPSAESLAALEAVRREAVRKGVVIPS